jgi:nucleotidyltransferase/DNA polymerase involved in DNA repair
LPVVIEDDARQKKVAFASSEARARGIWPGMPLRRALSLCPSAAFLESDPLFYRVTWNKALDGLESISPVVEDRGLGIAFVDLTGLVSHYGTELALGGAVVRSVLQCLDVLPSAGIASGKFPATAAAVAGAAGEITVVPAGLEAEFLSPLDVSLLPLDPEVIDRLRLFGLDVIGEVGCIALGDLIAQFGPHGKRLWQLCNGIDDDVLYARPPNEAVEESLSFEAPVASVDVLVACIRQLLSRVEVSLRGRAARELVISAEFDRGRTWEKRGVLKEAISEHERLAFILKSVLSTTPPPRPVVRLTLCLSGLTGETGKQLSFDDKSRARRQVEEAIRQLKVGDGHSPIYKVEEAEPRSPIPEDRYVLVESDG